MERVGLVGLVGLLGDDLGLGGGIQDGLPDLPAADSLLQEIVLPGQVPAAQRAKLGVQRLAEIRGNVVICLPVSVHGGEIEHLQLPIGQCFGAHGGHHSRRIGGFAEIAFPAADAGGIAVGGHHRDGGDGRLLGVHGGLRCLDSSGGLDSPGCLGSLGNLGLRCRLRDGDGRLGGDAQPVAYPEERGGGCQDHQHQQHGYDGSAALFLLFCLAHKHFLSDGPRVSFRTIHYSISIIILVVVKIGKTFPRSRKKVSASRFRAILR